MAIDLLTSLLQIFLWNIFATGNQGNGYMLNLLSSDASTAKPEMA